MRRISNETLEDEDIDERKILPVISEFEVAP